MKYFSTLALAAGLASVEAINLSKRTDGAPRVVQHSIQRRHVPNLLARERLRRKRSKTIQESLDNEVTLYFANVTMGTPAQTLRLHIDTGSSDLWVNTPNSTLCEGSSDPCAAAGTYDVTSSSTYTYLNSDFNITYVDGSGSSGDYGTDTLVLGGTTLKAQEFGLGFVSTSDEGIIGIGYALNEAILAVEGTTTYANVPLKMMEDGYINSNAYSLWLDDLEASTGSILFGGVNTDKYTGSLETVPIIKEEGEYAEFIIALTAVGVNGVSGSIASDLATPALLDSGSTLMYLPNDITSDIYTLTGATYDSSEGAAFIDCSYADNDTTIDFTFSSPTISVAMSELVIVAGEDNGEEICILGIAPADGTTPVLGDTFIRSAYIVYDLTNNEISLAQASFNSTGNTVLEITNGTSGVPDATLVTDAVTSVAVATGESGVDGGLTTTLTAAAQKTAAPHHNYAAMMAALGAGAMYAL